MTNHSINTHIMVSSSLAWDCYSSLMLMTLWSRWHPPTFWDRAADRKRLACSGTSWVWPAALQMVWAQRVVSSHSPVTGIRLGWTSSALSESSVLQYTNHLQLHLSFYYDCWRPGSNCGFNHVTLLMGNFCYPSVSFVLVAFNYTLRFLFHGQVIHRFWTAFRWNSDHKSFLHLCGF